jgi:hypothetical protein
VQWINLVFTRASNHAALHSYHTSEINSVRKTTSTLAVSRGHARAHARTSSKPSVVKVRREVRKAVREPGCVRLHDVRGWVTCALGDNALLHEHVCTVPRPSSASQPARHERVGHLVQEGLAVVAAKVVPIGPTHRRLQGGAIAPRRSSVEELCNQQAQTGESSARKVLLLLLLLLVVVWLEICSVAVLCVAAMSFAHLALCVGL